MKKILSVTHLVVFILMPMILLASQNVTQNQDPFRTSQFGEICRKVITFLNEHPSKHNLVLSQLVNEKVLTNKEFQYLIRNKIKYNPPSSAGKDDNFLSIFDIDYGDGTNSHILYTIVDKSNPKISKSGNLSTFSKYLTQWYDYKSNRKHLSVTKNDEKYFFSLSYYDNEHWDKQHLLFLTLNAHDDSNFKKISNLLDSYKLPYRTYESQDHLINIDVRLPSDLKKIDNLCKDILTNFYKLESKDPIEFIADGFRFNK